jgi:uncharacterized protein YndB with AHSA1/START domain
MPVVEHSADIRAPIDAVFDLLTDPRRSSEWNPNVVDVRDVQLPVDVGSTWRQTAIAVGRQMNLLCRVVRFERPHYGEVEISGDQRGRIWTVCQEGPGVTHVTQGIEFEVPGGMLGRLMGGVAGPMMERELVQTMERQRAALEGNGGPRAQG